MSESDRSLIATAASTGPLSATHLVRAARGFSCIFWGIPLALLLMARTMELQLFDYIPLPSYVMGTLVAYVGMMLLYFSAPPSRPWRALVRWGLFPLLLLIYFSPLLHWWRYRPYTPYYLANMAAMITCTIWALFLINRIASEMGSMLGEKMLRFEALVCGWCSVALVLIPGIPLALYAFYSSLHFDGDLYEGFIFAFRTVPRWLLALFILPFTLTMASAWQAKERCIDHIKARTQEITEI